LLKAAREQYQITYKGKHIRIPSEFSSQTLIARKAWRNIFQAEREEWPTKNILSSKDVLQP
jgi:hypothetical protein